MELRSFFLSLTLSLVTLLTVHGQGPEALLNQGREALLLGEYPKAVEKFGSFVQKYPSSTSIFQVRLWLGQSNFYAGKFDAAIEVLSKLANDKTLPDKKLQEDATFFMGQAFFSKAGESTGAAQESAFKDAIKAFDSLFKRFPDTSNKEDATYTRGLCHFFLRDYRQAQKEFKQLTTTFANSAIRAEHLYWYGYCYAANAMQMLADGKRGEAQALATEAYGIWERIQGKEAPIPHNNAMLQRAELQLVMADPSKREAQVALLKQALDTYRQVKTGSELRPIVDAAIKDLQAQAGVAGSRGNSAEQDRISREMNRLKGQIADIEGRPDPTTRAALGINRVFIYLNDYDASRVILKRVRQFEQSGLILDADIKKNIRFNDVLTLVLIGRVKEATTALAAFESDFPGDPMLESIDFLIGAQLIAKAGEAQREALAATTDRDQERAATFGAQAAQSLRAAIVRFERSLQKFPKGREADNVRMFMADAYTGLGQPDKAENTLRDLLKKVANKDLVPQIWFRLANAQMARAQADTKKAVQHYNEAAQSYRKVLDSPGDGQYKRSSAYQLGFALNSARKLKEARVQLEKALQKYPDQDGKDQNEPVAQFFLALIDLAQKQKEQAVERLLKIPAQYPDSQYGPYAYNYLADKIYMQERGGITKAIGVFEKLFEKYPESAQALHARVKLGSHFSNQREYETAQTHFQVLIDKKDPAWSAYALLQSGNMWLNAARAPGPWPALSEDQQQPMVRKRYDKAEEAFTNLIRLFPDTPVAKDGVDALVKMVSEKAQYKIIPEDQLLPYFEDLIARMESPLSKAQLTVGQAAVLFQTEGTRGKALRTYDSIREDFPDIQFTYEDIRRYGELLTDAERYDDAAKLFNDFEDYIKDPVNKVAGNVRQWATAEISYGRGMIKLRQKKLPAAKKHFKELEDSSPWYPQISTVNFELAKLEYNAGQLDTAEEYLRKVINNPNSPQNVTAQAVYMRGEIFEKRAIYLPKLVLKDPKKPKTSPYIPDPSDPGNAAAYYRKCDLFYGAAQPLIGAKAAGKYLEMIQKGMPELSNEKKVEVWQASLEKGIKHLLETYPESAEAARHGKKP